MSYARHPSEIVSHRGGSFLWPENSLEAFRNTLGLPIEQAECDVHLSADGTPMVIHDALLQRTTDGHGPVASHDKASLSRVRLRGAQGATLPTLAEVAALFANQPMELQVELKGDAQERPYSGLLEKTLAELDRAGIRKQCRIIAFDAGLAASARQAGGLAGVIWLFERRLLGSIGAQGVVAVAQAHGFDMVETEIGILDATLCSTLRQAGLRVGAWGANHSPSLTKAFGLGLDAVATDDPVLAARLRG
jgi:glycerophosphoryl diester phosphodiesterase